LPGIFLKAVLFKDGLYFCKNFFSVLFTVTWITQG
jgi:hypothetical protein